ncbi:SWI/SNF-related matrix-associated actin-dependent regulator of chromatin subfamily A-like protein 1, partial [Armadillidium nasatum]
MNGNGSTLTEEQRKRIEENRLKALERRAAFLKSKGNQCQSNNNNNNNNLFSNSLKNSISNQPSKPNVSVNWKPLPSVTSIKAGPPKSASTFYTKKGLEGIKDNPANGENPGFLGKKITGNCHLISKDRFVVNLPYHAQSIDIFKTMPSRQYDFNSKKWSFCITDHSNIMSALGPLRSSVSISPLPSYVLQALKKASNYPSSSSIDLMPLDPSLLEAFMPFQREGVGFGVSRDGRVLIADDMGLGKTIQALGIASYYRNEWPMLIVTPSSVRYSWAEAVDRWIESVDAYEVVVINTCKDSLEGTVIIISYDLLSKRAQEIKEMNFSVVVMDESHMLKNFKSIRYKSAAPIMKSCRRLILLSGTPALSRPSELYTQISSVDPKFISNFQDYGIRYCAGKQQQWGWDFSGSSNMEELQILLESTIMIRRLKSDVITQLPPKQRMTIILDPSSIKLNSKSMKEAAINFKKESLKGAEKHGALIQFFNESSSAKLKAVCEYVKELLTEGN